MGIPSVITENETICKYTLDELSGKLALKLKPTRLQHSQAVAYTAASIAMNYGVQDLKPFLYAGLLHDCAKYMYGTEFVDYCNENGLETDDDESLLVEVLHGIVGADIAEKEFGISDPDILNAIKHHTDGRPGMSFLEKVIHISDHIEPSRSFDMEPPLSEIRRMAFDDLDMAIYKMDKAIIDYLENAGKIVTKQAYRTVEYFKDLVKDRL